jgi:hypothetical protein
LPTSWASIFPLIKPLLLERPLTSSFQYLNPESSRIDKRFKKVPRTCRWLVPCHMLFWWQLSLLAFSVFSHTMTLALSVLSKNGKQVATHFPWDIPSPVISAGDSLVETLPI